MGNDVFPPAVAALVQMPVVRGDDEDGIIVERRVSLAIKPSMCAAASRYRALAPPKSCPAMSVSIKWTSRSAGLSGRNSTALVRVSSSNVP